MLIYVLVLSSIFNITMLVICLRFVHKFKYTSRRMNSMYERVSEGFFDRYDSYMSVNPQDFHKLVKRSNKMWKALKKREFLEFGT